MSSGEESAATPIGLGFRAVRGGAVVVGVAAGGLEPRVVLSAFLATAADGDRLSHEPYHIAYEMERGPGGAPSAEPAAVVAEGRKRQDRLAATGLDDIAGKLRVAGCETVLAALLVNRAGWMTNLLAHSLSAPAHPPVAEGLAVREALRFAFGRAGLRVVELDEKSLPELASTELRLAPADMDARLKSLGANAGTPWRKEQKLACLAAWVALARRR